MEREYERWAADFAKGAESAVCFQITGDRYNAGSHAVAVALLLFDKGGRDMVEKFFKALEYCEECS